MYTLSKKKKQLSPVIELPDEAFGEFLQRNRELTYKDSTIIVNGLYYLKTNRAQLSCSCKYFASMFSGKYKEKKEAKISLEHNNIVILQVLLNYLLLDHVVVPENMSYHNWMELYKLSEYFCLARLSVICEHQICNQISDKTCNTILEFGLKNQI